MNYSFRMSEEKYISVLKTEVVKERRSPPNVTVTLLCTVVQAAFIAICSVSGVFTGNDAIFLPILSAALFAVTAARQFMVTSEAKLRFNNAKKAGYMYQDLDSLIRLTIDDGVVRISGGHNQLSYDCGYFSGYGFIDDVIGLKFSNGTTVHRLLIPVETFGGRTGAAAFAAEISDIAYRNSLGESGEEKTECVVEYTCTAADYVKGMVSACRYAYTTRYMWTPTFLLRILLAILFIRYVASGTLGSPLADFIACVGAFFMLYNVIITFTPAMKASAIEYTKDLYGDRQKMDFTASVTENYFICRSEGFSSSFALDRISVVEKTGKYLYIYIQGNVIMAIPAAGTDPNSLSRCYILLSAAARKNRLAKQKPFTLFKKKKNKDAE